MDWISGILPSVIVGGILAIIVEPMIIGRIKGGYSNGSRIHERKQVFDDIPQGTGQQSP